MSQTCNRDPNVRKCVYLSITIGSSQSRFAISRSNTERSAAILYSFVVSVQFSLTSSSVAQKQSIARGVLQPLSIGGARLLVSSFLEMIVPVRSCRGQCPRPPRHARCFFVVRIEPACSFGRTTSIVEPVFDRAEINLVYMIDLVSQRIRFCDIDSTSPQPWRLELA